MRTLADFVIVKIKDRDLVRLLQHLHAEIPKNVRHGFGPALVARGRIAHAGNEISPCFFTTSAAWGFKIGLV